MTLREALTHPDFLIVRIDPQFAGRYARVIHRVRDASHPSGRTAVFHGEAETILAELRAIKRGGQLCRAGGGLLMSIAKKQCAYVTRLGLERKAHLTNAISACRSLATGGRLT